MEVILKQNIKGLGYKNDVVSVKSGYGRNYLIPQGFALIANASNRKLTEEIIKQVAHKAEKIKADAEGIANAIGDTLITIPTRAGENGKIFGSITSIQLAEFLKSKGFDVDRKQISMDSDAKFIGDYTATLDLHKEVKHTIKVKVIEE